MTARASKAATQHLARFVATLEELNVSERPHAPGRFKDGRSELDLLLIPQEAELSSNPAWEPFQQRLRALDAVQKEVIPALQSAVCDYAVEVWLTAKKSADLESAVRALANAKAPISHSDWWVAAHRLSGGSALPASIESLRGPDGRMMAVEVYEILSIIGVQSPLLLPDPVSDPAGYAAVRADWQALKKMSFSFVQRPVVAARFSEMERKLESELEARRAALHEAMLSNATAKEFDSLLKRFVNLLPTLPETAAKAPTGLAFQRIGTAPPNYRDLIDVRNANSPSSQRIGRPEAKPSPEILAYRWWLGLRQTEEAGEKKSAVLTKEEIDGHLTPLPKSLRDSLAARHTTAPASAPPPPVPVASTPLATLLATLKNRLSNESVGPLLAAWRRFDGAKGGVETSDGNNFRAVWFALAREAGGVRLFTLRDRAAETVLAEISENAVAKTRPAGASLEAQIREMLASACLAGNFEKTSRLLALDRACGALDPDEHAAYREACDVFQKARKMAKNGHEDRARRACVNLIRKNGVPEISDLAARMADG